MLVFDLFAGTGSATKAFADAGDTVVRFEINKSFEAEEHIDIMMIDASKVLEKYGRPDFVWASPPCTSFSIASAAVHWDKVGDVYTPKSESGSYGRLVGIRTLELIKQLDPKYGFLIENPRGLLRKMPFMQGVERQTIHYCQYGDTRMKPTDLFGYVPNWIPRDVCSPGSSCHEAAPRGSKNSGTQGLDSAEERSMVAPELSVEIREALLEEFDG